ncbi:hypothetical protein PanWU01x14_325720 [Parasponia andersonii]|uniref:Uncharacterized protein n=1 Tax=Parasponia andersonii TaxID=3476 RepID=A0A2P5AJR1_PARAD|nr:hypothetical protein PanWU01x14_325720 [Parasponia andersonii]
MSELVFQHVIFPKGTRRMQSLRCICRLRQLWDNKGVMELVEKPNFQSNKCSVVTQTPVSLIFSPCNQYICVIELASHSNRNQSFEADICFGVSKRARPLCTALQQATTRRV